ncbi:MAG: hypothetical protein E7615_01040 [Ruminococcaceae bacterium]|nr:hypothetical protein [Oscillospiraceae bacterium]
MKKKTLLYAGISLIVQSVSMAVLFFLLLPKKKSLANTFLAMSAIGGIAGGICLYKHAKKVKEEREFIEEFLGSEELGEDMEILTDEEVDEAEFC